jgi:hypothetical protein
MSQEVQAAGLVGPQRTALVGELNLRASRQTELTDRFPAHVVCKWLGNTETIARESYLQTLDAHLTRVIESSQSGDPDPMRAGGKWAE